MLKQCDKCESVMNVEMLKQCDKCESVMNVKMLKKHEQNWNEFEKIKMIGSYGISTLAHLSHFHIGLQTNR